MRLTPAAVPGDEFFYRYLEEQERKVDGKASVTQTTFLTFFIATASNKDYRILVNAPVAMTINSITTISSAGTCTLTGKINTTALGGTANSVSTSEQTQTHTSANAVAAGDDIVLTVSANSGATDVSVTIACTSTLAA